MFIPKTLSTLPGTVLSLRGKKAKLIILMYHRVLADPDPYLEDDVDVEAFDWQMSIIHKYYNNLPLPEAVSRLKTGTLPSRTVCITFDDGYQDNYSLALPILQKWNLTATFFIASGFLNGGRMWNDTVIESIRRTKKEELDLSHIGLGAVLAGNESNRVKLIDGLLGKLKYDPMELRLDKVNELAKVASVDLPKNLMMTTDQVKLLSSNNMDIGAHTKNHPILTSIPSDQAFDEVIKSRDELADMLGQKIRSFAYPNGKPGRDYDQQHVNMMKQAGFELAVSTAWGFSNRLSDSYQLPRISPWDKTPMRFGLRILKSYTQQAGIV